MVDSTNQQPVRIFSTCLPSNLAQSQTYLQQVVEIARWSEAAGCDGMLVYTDNGLVDPWIVAHTVIEQTERLSPLVAVQPVSMHPYSVAKLVASLGFLHGRRVYLNMVAGGFKNDLTALGDLTPHDERYDRLIEYTSLILDLLRSPEPVTREGRYYRVTNLKMTPPLPPHLLPGVFLSGSSEAGLAAARLLGATAVQYPRPVTEYVSGPPVGVTESGIRIGVIAREDGEEAWTEARRRFPEDRKGQLTHQLAMKVSDSVWHKQLSILAQRDEGPEQNPYWLVPFENYKTFCPYLVGSYERVAHEVARYVGVGYRTFILDVPASAGELAHIGVVFERALAHVA